MKKTYLQKGFTLIELLVVIAIIGILSSVVLASLSTARNKGKATAVKSGMASLRSQMEIKADGGNYGIGTVGLGDDECNLSGANYVADDSAKNIVANIIANAGTGKLYCSTNAASAASNFAIAAVLPDNSGVQCTDNSGNTKFYAGITVLTTTQMTGGICQ